MPADYRAALRQALAQAADDLDIKVTLRDSVSGNAGTEQPCVALIAEFGSPNGIVIFDDAQWWDEAGHAAEQAVGAFSTLGRAYAEYDRDLYIDALTGWAGSGSASRRRGTAAASTRSDARLAQCSGMTPRLAASL